MIGSCRRGSQSDHRRNTPILPTGGRSPEEIVFVKEAGRRGYHENKVRSRKEGKGLRVVLRVEKGKMEGFIWENGF